MAGRTLTVMLAADTSRFRAGMQTAGRSADTFGSRVNNMAGRVKSAIGPAMAGAALAAGAFAIKMGVDGVNAAIDQEKKLADLDSTLKQMGWADQKDDARDFIDQLARVTLFDDGELIKPLQDMARAIGGEDGLTKAMEVLPGLLDASQKSGKDLPTIVAAAAKAANGNTTALQRMFPWLRDSADGTLDFASATQQLDDKFRGGATEATQTFAGKIQNAGKAFDELKEAFGLGFLEGLGNADDAIGEEGLTGTLYDLQDTMKGFGKNIGDFVIMLGKIAGLAGDIGQGFTDLQKNLADPKWKAIIAVLEQAFVPLSTRISDLIDNIRYLTGTPQPGTGNLTNVDLGGLQGRPVNLGGGGTTPPLLGGNRALTEQAVGSAISNIIAKTDARRGYVVGGVLQ